MKPVLQTGNSVSATWRARLDEHLGNFTVEGLNLRASSFFAAPHAVYGVTHLAALMRLLPERDPHADLYVAARRHSRPARRRRLSLRPWWCASNCSCSPSSASASILSQCAATGATADLIYVSPKSGRAVSRAAGEPYADRLLRLPAFLREPDAVADGRDVADGFALTGFFLARYVLEPRGLALADERAHFIAALTRALVSMV